MCWGCFRALSIDMKLASNVARGTLRAELESLLGIVLVGSLPPLPAFKIDQSLSLVDVYNVYTK